MARFLHRPTLKISSWNKTWLKLKAMFNALTRREISQNDHTFLHQLWSLPKKKRLDPKSCDVKIAITGLESFVKHPPVFVRHRISEGSICMKIHLRRMWSLCSYQSRHTAAQEEACGPAVDPKCASVSIGWSAPVHNIPQHTVHGPKNQL